MHLRVTIGGKYTNVVADIPVPVMDWIWQSIHDKYFAEKFEKSAELRKIEAARKMYEEAAELKRLQTILSLAESGDAEEINLAKALAETERKFAARMNGQNGKMNNNGRKR